MTDDQTRAYDTTQPAEGPASIEPAPEVAPAATPGPAGGASRMRWILGLGAAAVVLALTAGAFLLLGGSATPEALKYIPADAAMVVEVRMDLPGDQMQKLGNLLAHFPGFADQSTLTAKIDEAFSRLVREGTDGETDYVTDVKPWLNGPLFVAADATALGDDGERAPERFLVAATTNGAVACEATFEGQPVTHETYKGLDLSLTADGKLACTIDGRFGIGGDPASVRTAIDTRAAGTGMNTSSTYLEARRSLAGDQLGTMYFSGAALRTAMPSPDPSLAIPGLGALGGELPEWFVLGLRAEDDAAVFDVVSGPMPAPSAGPSLLTVPPAHPSAIAGLVPADTMLYLEAQGTGVALHNLITILRGVPDLQEQLAVLDGMAKPEELVGWVDDLGIAVSAHGTEPSAAQPELTILLVAKDAATATDKVASVRTLLTLAASGISGLEVKQEDIAGVSVTTVTITDLGSLVPPGSIPELGDLPISGELSFSIAARDRVVYMSVGDGTMAKVLGVTAATSLAEDATFKQAATRAIPNSQLTLYAAVGATIDLVEPLLPADAAAQWTTEVAPYADPVRALAVWAATDASGSRSRMVVTVATP